VRRNLFWLSDEQWKRIEPHLPTDVRGIERADDRRVISGIVQVLKTEEPHRPLLVVCVGSLRAGVASCAEPVLRELQLLICRVLDQTACLMAAFRSCGKTCREAETVDAPFALLEALALAVLVIGADPLGRACLDVIDAQHVAHGRTPPMLALQAWHRSVSSLPWAAPHSSQI
jgi:hypothetical protein